MGDPSDPDGAFSWCRIELNLPGMPEYDPSLPRVWKIRIDGLTAADLKSFFDDIQVYGPTKAIAARALRTIIAGLQWLGMQDAPCKRRAEVQQPRAWAGCIAWTDQNLVRTFLTLPKWVKAQSVLKWISDQIGLDGTGEIP